MFKNQLQELAQRSCFNLPSYACTREGPDHAPRFKASVNFNGEIFESPTYSPTLRQAEHSAAEVALNVLSSKGPSRSLTARVLDETGIYKNLLQETAHRAGLKLPVYTTVRSGPGHVPIFTCTVELAGMSFTGEPAKTKKQAEKNAAIAAWSALKRMPNLHSLTNKDADIRDQDQDQAVVAGVLSKIRSKEESKYARKRDQNQARRRMVRGNRDNSCASSSLISSNSQQYQNWKLLDLLLDSGADCSSSQKQNSFMSLLPPPPPRTTSKILPPKTSTWNNPSHHQSSRPFPAQVRGKPQMHTHEIQAPLEEHQKDEDEWLGGKSDKNKKPIDKDGSSSSNASTVFGSTCVSRPFATANAGKLGTFLLDKSNIRIETRTHVGGIPFGPSVASSSIKAPSSGRPIYTGGFNPSHTLAPAVQIRSVIPVCAAPPHRPSPSPAAEASVLINKLRVSPSTNSTTEF